MKQGTAVHIDLNGSSVVMRRYRSVCLAVIVSKDKGNKMPPDNHRGKNPEAAKPVMF